jgi:hypothetical protein
MSSVLASWCGRYRLGARFAEHDQWWPRWTPELSWQPSWWSTFA